MKQLVILLLLLLLPFPAQAQTGRDEGDELTADAEGRERLEILVAQTTANREDHAARAIEFGEEALELLRSHPDRVRQLELLNSLSYAKIILGDYRSALELSYRAEELAREAEDKSARAFALRNLGRVHRSSSAYQSAFEAYAQAAELYAEIDDRPGLGDALNDTGIVHWMLGDYPKALEYFLRARRHYEESGDLRRVASILNNTGMIHRRLEQYARALELYQEALELRRQVGPAGAVSNVLNNIGNVYRDQGESARALQYYLDSLDAGPKDQHGYSNTLINAGSAYEDLGDLDRAMGFYRRAIDVKKALGDDNGVAYSLRRIGSLQRQQGEWSPGLESLRQALAIHQELGTKDEIKDTHLELSKTYAEIGRYREALAAFQEFERFKSEIFNQQNSETIAEMEARFESERNQKEIEILKSQRAVAAAELKRQTAGRWALYSGLVLLSLVVGLLYNRYRLKARSARLIERQNRELEQAMTELKESEHQRRRLEREEVRRQERERYIGELEAKNDEVEARNAEMERFTYTLSHELKSPMVTIRGFLGMLQKDTRTGDRDRAGKDLEHIDTAVRRMAQLLDELLEMISIGRLVKAPEEVSIGELAKEAAALVAADHTGRPVEIDIAPDLPAVHGDRQRLTEALLHLIENAFKFTAEQPQPRVEVGCRRHGTETAFYVRDNGVGIDPRYHERVFDLFERLDVRTEGTGVGLALTKRIVELHGGRVWVESEGSGCGSTFCFTLSSDRQADRNDSPPPSPTLRIADYGKLFQHAYDAILILDPAEETVLDVNQRACELYGFARGEFIGRSMLELTATHRRAVDHVRPTLESQGRYSFETVHRRKDSSEIRVEVRAAAVEFRGRRAILSINRELARGGASATGGAGTADTD